MEFLDSLRGAPNTRSTYTSLYLNHIESVYNKYGSDLFDERQMFAICQKWENHDHLSPRTIKMLLIVTKKLAAYHKMTFDTKQLVKDFCRTQQAVPKAITATYAQEVLARAKAEGQNFYVAVLLGLHAGLRVSEAISLTPADVVAPWLLIGNSSTTKNGRGRKIRMTPHLQTEIGQLTIVDGKVIGLTASIINKKLHKIAGISYHVLRHTFSTLALEAGVSPKLVQHALGHKSLMTTLDTYWNAVQDGISDFGFLPEVK